MLGVGENWRACRVRKEIMTSQNILFSWCGLRKTDTRKQNDVYEHNMNADSTERDSARTKKEIRVTCSYCVSSLLSLSTSPQIQCHCYLLHPQLSHYLQTTNLNFKNAQSKGLAGETSPIASYYEMGIFCLNEHCRMRCSIWEFVHITYSTLHI